MATMKGTCLGQVVSDIILPVILSLCPEYVVRRPTTFVVKPSANDE